MRKLSLKKTAAVFFLLTLLGIFSACGGDSNPDGQMAKINDTVITNSQFENFCILWLYTQGFDPSETLDADQKTLAKADMINGEVLRQYYEKDPEVFSEKYQSSQDTFLQQMKTKDAEFLESHNISEEDIETYYRSQYLTEVCFEKIRSEQSEEALMEKAEAYYKEHEEEFADQTFEEALEEIYYLLYSEMYGDKLTEIKKDMSIEE